jgi:hypothetical protein
MSVSEPMTLLTDYLLAALVLVFALRLSRSGHPGQMSTRMWSLAFYASAAAALVGGTYHGFNLYLSPLAAVLLWKVTVYAVGLASLFLFAGAVFAALAETQRRVLLVLAGSKFILYAAWMATHNDFRYVIYDYVPTLIFVLLLQGFAFWKRREESAPWIVGGIVVSFVGAGVQASGFALHAHFNHNDLYHVIQMGVFWLLYRGGLRLRDR